MLRNVERFSDTIIQETGKTYEDAQLEIAVAAQAFGFWAKKATGYLADERTRARAPMIFGRRGVVRHKLYGVVGVIGPWNHLPARQRLLRCCARAHGGQRRAAQAVRGHATHRPARRRDDGGVRASLGWLEVVTGSGDTGAAVVDEADWVMFTGSVATGRKVAERAAQTLTPVSLELGGKDPMIVLADADLERAANGAAYDSMLNSGQVCMAVERVYVEEPVYDAFVEKVVAKIEGLRQGAPGGRLRVDRQRGARGRRSPAGSRPARAASTTHWSPTSPSRRRWAAGSVSGIGSRHGPGGIRKYCRTQTVLVTRFAPKRDLHMFPYEPYTIRLMGRVTRLPYGRGRA